MNTEKQIILEILQGQNLQEHIKKLGRDRVEIVNAILLNTSLQIKLIKQHLTDEIAKTFFSRDGKTLKISVIETWLEDNKENLTGSGENNKKPSENNDKSKKQIILEIFRGENIKEHNEKFGLSLYSIKDLLEEDDFKNIKVELIEQHLTEQVAESAFKSSDNLTSKKIRKWLENNKSLLSGATENGNGPTSPEPEQKGPGSPSQNGDNPQTTQTLNDNWEKGVQALISGQTDLNKFFSRLMNKWKSIVETNQKVDRKEWDEKDQRNLDEADRDKENSFLNADEIGLVYLAEKVENKIEDELENQLKKDARQSGDKTKLISKIEKTYNLELPKSLKDNKRKINNLVKLLFRPIVENILNSDPFASTQMQNSWEKKILDLADQSFADNPERKSIAQKIAYQLISQYGFSENSSFVEKKTKEIKELLSQFSISSDPNKIKKYVSELLQVFHAGIKAYNYSISVSWEVPTNLDAIRISASDDEDRTPNLSLCFPVFPAIKNKTDGKVLIKIWVVEMEKWDKNKPVETENNNTSDTVPDVSSAKEQAAKERENKQKREAEEVKNSVAALNNENLSETERFAKLEEAENKEGKKSYQSNETDIQKGKKALFTKNPNEYRKTMAKIFRKKITNNELSEAELIKMVEEWEKNQENDWEKVKDLEKKTNQKIGQAVAKKKVNAIENRIKQVLKTGDKNEMFTVLKDLLVLFNDTQDDIYLAEHKNQVQKLTKDLEAAISGKKVNDNSTNKGFWQPKVLIPLGIGVAIVVVIVVVAIRSRQKRKRK